jgi:hypothetical protein
LEKCLSEDLMRHLFILLGIVMPFSMAAAETPSSKQPDDTRHSQHSTGKTELKDNGQMQPQGPTGPITTGRGGAPAESPQGQSPPNMQPAPDGSSKTIEGPK